MGKKVKVVSSKAKKTKKVEKKTYKKPSPVKATATRGSRRAA